MLFMLTMKTIRQNTLKKIKQKVSRMKLVFLINRLKIKFKIKLRRYRPELKQRQMQRAKHTINFGTELLLSKTAFARAAKKLHMFMFRADMNYQTALNINFFCNTVKYVQQAWRRHNQSLKDRMSYLEELWQKLLSKIQTYLSKKKAKQYQDFLKNCGYIDPAIQKRVVYLFMFR